MTVRRTEDTEGTASAGGYGMAWRSLGFKAA